MVPVQVLKNIEKLTQYWAYSMTVCVSLIGKRERSEQKEYNIIDSCMFKESSWYNGKYKYS